MTHELRLASRPHSVWAWCTCGGFDTIVHVGGMRNADEAREYARTLYVWHLED